MQRKKLTSQNQNSKSQDPRFKFSYSTSTNQFRVTHKTSFFIWSSSRPRRVQGKFLLLIKVCRDVPGRRLSQIYWIFGSWEREGRVPTSELRVPPSRDQLSLIVLALSRPVNKLTIKLFECLHHQDKWINHHSLFNVNVNTLEKIPLHIDFKFQQTESLFIQVTL